MQTNGPTRDVTIMWVNISFVNTDKYSIVPKNLLGGAAVLLRRILAADPRVCAGFLQFAGDLEGVLVLQFVWVFAACLSAQGLQDLLPIVDYQIL